MKETNVTHNIRVDKNQSNRKVYEAWNHTEWPLSDPKNLQPVDWVFLKTKAVKSLWQLLDI